MYILFIFIYLQQLCFYPHYLILCVLLSFIHTTTLYYYSVEQMNFIKCFEDPNSTLEEKKKKLVAAGNKHKDLTNHAMSGGGVDRHIFALYILSRGGFGLDAPFLKEILSIPWRLSTSQLPQRQTDRWRSEEFLKKEITDPRNLLSPSGGFGPVDDKGYGVSYMVAGENDFFFHVSSKRHATVTEKPGGERITDSRRFTNFIHQAMKDIMKVCEVELPGAKKE
jgi:hypothetical protein